MKEKYMNSLKHVLLICLFVVLGVEEGLANQNTYPFRTTLTVQPTGAGKVYASYNSNAAATTEDTRNYDQTISSWNDYGCTTTVTLSATANAGYRFIRWTDGEGNLYSNLSTTTASLTYNADGARYNEKGWFIWAYLEYTTRRQFKFTAQFALQGNVIARVASGQETIGSADILDEVLTPGETITLMASNINGSEFDGWSFDHWELNGETVSTSKELKVTVPTSDQTLIYVAHFVKADTEYYCFIRNKSTGKYLKLSNSKAYTKPTGTSNPVGSFNGSFTLVEETQAISDPGCVFTIAGHSKDLGIEKATIVSQGVAVGFLPGSSIINDNTYGLTITPASVGAYLISANYHVSQSGQEVDIPIYFRDNNGTPDIAALRSATSEWELLELSAATLSQQYFGLAPNAALEKDGKFYTTLYTTFPYKLQSGKAYYVNHESIVPYGDESEGKFRVVCQEIAGGKVPANEAVIIECEGTDPASNKIVPIPQNESVNALSGNFLRSNIAFRDGVKTGDGKIYVLSVGKNSGVGFYKLKTGTPLPDNKAYSSLNEEQQGFAKNATFIIGEDDLADESIATSLDEVVMLTEDFAGNEIYDLQGRRVKNPTRGIYVVNGKKFIVK